MTPLCNVRLIRQTVGGVCANIFRRYTGEHRKNQRGLDGHVSVEIRCLQCRANAKSAIPRGFGSQMAGTEMVIMWANTDGSITLSQRKATGEIMPTVDSSPSRVATLSTVLSSVCVETFPRD